MVKISISEFKKNITEYVEILESNLEDEIIVCRYSKPVFRISSLPNCTANKGRCGCGSGIVEDLEFSLKDGFDCISKEFGY